MTYIIPKHKQKSFEQMLEQYRKENPQKPRIDNHGPQKKSPQKRDAREKRAS